MDIDPASLSPTDRYKLLIGAIVPRPIAWVSTLSPEGARNLAPFSFFCGVGSNPMTLAFCPASDDAGGDKDTLRNCLPTDQGGLGEFVVNVAPAAIAHRVAATAEPLDYGHSEFGPAGLTERASVVVAPPSVAQSPLAFECRTRLVHRTNPGVAGSGNLVLGEVVHVHADDGLIDQRRRIDPERLGALGRMGGRGYCRTTDRFEMPWGLAALDAPPMGHATPGTTADPHRPGGGSG